MTSERLSHCMERHSLLQCGHNFVFINVRKFKEHFIAQISPHRGYEGFMVVSCPDRIFLFCLGPRPHTKQKNMWARG